jgi:hypothetical protein
VRSKALTLSSRVTHCVRESTSSMNFSVVVRFFRDAVGMFCSVSVAELRDRASLGAYVVYGGECAVWSSHFSACISEALKCLLLWCKR